MATEATVPFDTDPEGALYEALDRTVGLDGRDPLSAQVDVEALTDLVRDSEVYVEFVVWDAHVWVTPSSVEARTADSEAAGS